MSIRAVARSLVAIALAAMLAGCFGGRSTERESESWWDKDEVAVAVPERAPEPVPEYTVAHGDTLYMIAFRRGLDWRELAAWNHIAAPYTIYPDQRLKLGPERPASPPESPGSPLAPASSAPSALSESAASLDMPDEYVEPGTAEPAPTEEPAPVERTSDASDSGDTATYAVRDSGPAEVAPAPAPPKSEPVRPKAEPNPEAAGEGSLTRAMRGSTPPPPAASPAPAAKPEPPKPAVPETPVVSAPAPTSAAAPPAPGPARSAGGASWRWPAQGTLVGRFLPGDPARQGINVQGKPGGIVSAASDGEVVYSGNGLVGYGELIIVKHSGELLSAYGGSGKRLVAEGTKVRSGQPLAELAGNGIVHFEIRRSGKPVDPLEYLPSR